jgi:hypothetical protein
VRVVRGTKPEHVAVSFEISRGENTDFDLNIPKALYHARQGWSGGVDASFRVYDHTFLFGVVNDGDALAERFAGLHAGYQLSRIGTEALGIRFRFESYRSIWNDSTLNDFVLPFGTAPGYDVAGIYRTRQSLAPELVYRPVPFLEFAGGVRLTNFETQYPESRTESANAVTGSMRLRRSWEGDHKQELEGGYQVRAVTRQLDSDFAYTRHAVDARYKVEFAKAQVIFAFLAGRLEGRAPLFDRFILGNFTTLRGWNKFDLSPLGASRVAHGTAEVRYEHFEIFYDTGMVWDTNRNPGQKHSVGGGLHFRGFHVAVAFPLRSGGLDPVFMVGTAF